MRRCLRAIIFTPIIAVLSQAQPAKFALDAISSGPVIDLDLGTQRLQAQRILSSGDVAYGLFYKSLAVLRASLRTGNSEVFDLQPPPEAQATSFSTLSDLDIGDDGSIYVPVVWADAPDRRACAGVVVWSSQGKYQRTIKLDPYVNLRHVAVDKDGSVFVLGMDSASFKTEKADHPLLHKYTPAGIRVASFSPTSLSRPGDAKALRDEIDLGKLWLQGGQLWQMQPVTRSLRVFATDGSRIREIRFAPPKEGAGKLATAWNILPAGDGKFVVDWLLEEISGDRLLRWRGVALHGGDGQPLSGMAGAADGIDMPLACNPAGFCVTLRLGPANQPTMGQARIRSN